MGGQFSRARFLLSAFSMEQLPEPDRPEIAFAGRSNVGKSSLMNRLLGRRNLVKTSSRPGKTQSLNYFLANEQIYLVDLPGYGFARVSKQVRASWQGLIRRYLKQRRNLVCVVVLVDIRHELKESDRKMIGWLRRQGRVVLPVYTKSDKVSRNILVRHKARLDRALAIAPEESLAVSARTGAGCEELQRRLALYSQNW